MPAFLVPVDAGQCLIPLEKAIVLIGRQVDCDVSLSHSRKISRRHCCIAQVNNKFVVRDLGSTNGVFLNGSRVHKESAIEMGDDLVIGDVRFRLQNEAPGSVRAGSGKQATLPKANQNTAGAPSAPAPPPIPVRRVPDFPPIPESPKSEGGFRLLDESTRQSDGDTTRGREPRQ